ncbi:MAG: YggS family pyridoxal phosphate-dependent enzyme [Planctomycetes bacterium]|nr:YggS family pyridoxal phosphate-dependent enzyme [Planctomycetota bacterium]
MDLANPSVQALLAANVRSVRERIARACERAARDPAGVHLVAVTKAVGLETVRRLADLGVRDFGENRVQQAAERIPNSPPGATWHLIGHLQTNKARKAAELFPVIHSVDSARLADVLAVEAAAKKRTIRVLVQVNLSDEPQKAGCPPAEAEALAARVLAAPGLALEGLMTMAREEPDPESARPCFRALRVLSADLHRALRPAAPFPRLSMGMSQDFEVAVEEGATWVRVGSALFQGLAPSASGP